MHELIICGRKYDCPSCWEELDEEMLVAVAGIIHRPMEVRQALAEILLLLLRVKKYFHLRFCFAFVLTPESKYDLLKAVQWVLEHPNRSTKQKIPVLKCPGLTIRKLYGPQDDCRGLVFMEFIEADTAYMDFWHAKSDKERISHLDKLVAILYRPRNLDMPKLKAGQSRKMMRWNGDPRCAYNPNVVKYRLEMVSKISIRHKYAILMFYDACHKRMEANHSRLFAKAESKESSGSGGWASALMHLAGGSINIDRMMCVNAAAALRDLEERLAELEKNEIENK